MEKQKQFLNRLKAIASNIISNNNSISGLLAEYNALDLGNTISDEVLAELEITKTDMTNAINSFIAFQTLFGQGHNTNFYKVK